MSLDRSLKTSGNLSAQRSVMTRAERIAAMKESGKIDPEKRPVIGLPKTKARKLGR